MLRLIVLLFIVAPTVDLYLVYRLGQAWGFWPTAAYVLGGALAGSLVARAQGLRMLRSFRGELAAGRPPVQMPLESIAVLAGALLLLAPGPVTDVLGLALIFQPSRGLLLRFARRSIERAVERGELRFSVLRMDGHGRPAWDDGHGAPSDLDPSKEIRMPPRPVGPGEHAEPE